MGLVQNGSQNFPRDDVSLNDRRQDALKMFGGQYPLISKFSKKRDVKMMGVTLEKEKTQDF